MGLTGIRWTEAEVGWKKPSYACHAPGKRAHPRAIYAHAVSRYSYRTARAWKRLTGLCGLDRGHSGSVVFVVRGDGRELFRSGTIRDHDEHPLAVDISGVDVLELVVEDAGDGKNSDHGIWFNPRLTR